MAFATIDVTKGITGTIPVANGGTGLASGTSGQFLKFTGSTTIASAGAGIDEIDQWRVTSSFDLDGTTDPVSANLERVDGTGQAKLGTGMSESSGIWTFPSTGFWIVEAGFTAYGRGPVAQARIMIYTTANNSAYNQSTVARQAMVQNDYYGSGYCSTVVDVTDTANVKVKFVAASSANTNFNGSTNNNWTYFTFKRMADT
jgi:hypothetical protein